MSVAKAPIRVQVPLAVSTNHNIMIQVNAGPNDPKDLTGITVLLLVRDLGGTVRSYTGVNQDQAVAATKGKSLVTIVGSNHTTVGDADEQVHIDGILRARYVQEFVEKLSV